MAIHLKVKMSTLWWLCTGSVLMWVGCIPSLPSVVHHCSFKKQWPSFSVKSMDLAVFYQKKKTLLTQRRISLWTSVCAYTPRCTFGVVTTLEVRKRDLSWHCSPDLCTCGGGLYSQCDKGWPAGLQPDCLVLEWRWHITRNNTPLPQHFHSPLVFPLSPVPFFFPGVFFYTIILFYSLPIRFHSSSSNNEVCKTVTSKCKVGLGSMIKKERKLMTKSRP